ncbi:mannonate dehydratase [Pedobacter cryotolerans]|uniref:Mannonate dehydratase n=2 Tax=Pedobacter cryotolerans TaxID=2571270 RepID=A0A4U1BYT4_9SPHI|nr:mannonate dehydratase [Pedobacter cryotolerans]
MIQTMRWYGPEDIVKLEDIRQAGCAGIVTALHHIPVGEIWSIKQIQNRKKQIEDYGMDWAVVESLPVHEDIKKRTGHFKQYIENYKISLRNLANQGIHVVTYNFMPVIDWMRTDLRYKTKTGALALRFEKLAFIAFDLYLLKRENAEKDYTEEEVKSASIYFAKLDEEAKKTLMSTCLQGLPGSKESFTSEKVLNLIREFSEVSTVVLRENLISFLQEISQVADENNMQLAIHPDDPPYPILGLPRIVSTEADLKYLQDQIPSKSNGICFCSGSLGARPDNDLSGIIKRMGNRIYFLHLRSVELEGNENFHEANHLEGSANMFELVNQVVELMEKQNRAIPMRPDHGHQMLDDLAKNPYPGYSAIGRLKGLAELRGLEMGIQNMKILNKKIDENHLLFSNKGSSNK